ncbi:MAG TPA: NUDIX domain-containing protein [Thermoanaerobaculia bacterium]|jgi:8-oxo-dGTP pyrophosphatase MutT (NUDIX family)
MSSTNVRDDQLPRGAGSGAADTRPLPAATVLVLRDDPFEVLMLRRTETSSFVPGAWVFPGGVMEQIDRDLSTELLGGSFLGAMRVTAARELFEETGLWLGEPLEDAESKRRRLLAGSLSFRSILNDSPVQFDQLVWTARWITPVAIPKRFDTYFFLAKVPRGAVATAEESESVEALWISPEHALARHAAGELGMVLPTIKNLEAITGFHSAEALLDSRRGVEVPAIEPVLIVENGQKKIVIP